MWQTHKYYFGVDFIVIATLPTPQEDGLLLFHVSTRKTDHEPLIPSEVHMLVISDDTTPLCIYT